MFSSLFCKNEHTAQTLGIDSILFIPQLRHPLEKNTCCWGSQLIVPPLLLKTRLLSSTSQGIPHFPTINISPYSRGIVGCVHCLSQQIFLLVAVFRIRDILISVRIRYLRITDPYQNLQWLLGCKKIYFFILFNVFIYKFESFKL